jgi:hypothetical protein
MRETYPVQCIRVCRCSKLRYLCPRWPR